MSLCPYLSFNGNCREAMTFYAKVFGADDLMFMTPEDAPGGEMDDFPADGVMHAQFTMGGATLMGSDTPPAFFQPQAGVSVYHAAASFARGKEVFEALAKGGEVTMPFAKTFWSKGFGVCRDRFGTGWMVSLTQEAEDAA